MGSPIVSTEGFTIKCDNCGSYWCRFEYNGNGGIEIICENCRANSSYRSDEEDTNEYTIVFENVESFKTKDLIFDIEDGEIVYIEIDESKSTKESWYSEFISIKERILKYQDIVSVYVNDRRIDVNWKDLNECENKLQKVDVYDDVIVISFYDEESGEIDNGKNNI